MKKKYSIGLLIIILIVSFSCKTIDIEKMQLENSEEQRLETEEKAKTNYMVEDIVRKMDIEQAVVRVSPPEVRFQDSERNEKLKINEEEELSLEGKQALIQNLKDNTTHAEYKDGNLRKWIYEENKIYEVHCQTYHSTLIILEAGEEMTELPYISEPEVWRISRGISNQKQYLIIKPDYKDLISTLIVMTTRRVYQMELKSYSDHYMPTVSWVYPRRVEDRTSWTNWEKEKAIEFSEKEADYLSFDYIISYSIFKKPVWCPTIVYDDGRKTYFVLDKKSLHTEFPVLFNKKNELINYYVKENTIIANQLIEKAILRLGSQKVSIEKKKSKEFDDK